MRPTAYLRTMAQYRLSITRASRKDGRAATAMAAYRAGAYIEDRRTGLVFDYTRKGGILHTEIIGPEGTPAWAYDRSELWNRSEYADRRGDAQIAREVQLSLPYEMNHDQRREITLEYARYLSDRFQVAVDVAIHEPNRDGDERNHHAHLLLCTRPFDDEGKTGFGNKNRELDAVSQRKLGQSTVGEELRERWTSILNNGLERADIRTDDGALVVLDHRSYERQGIDLEATVKLGVSASAIDRRGGISERGRLNEEIAARNELRRRADTETRDIENNLQRLQQQREQSTEWTATTHHARAGRELTASVDAEHQSPAPTEQEQALTIWKSAQDPPISAQPNPMPTSPPPEPEPAADYNTLPRRKPDYDGPGFG